MALNRCFLKHPALHFCAMPHQPTFPIRAAELPKAKRLLWPFRGAYCGLAGLPFGEPPTLYDAPRPSGCVHPRGMPREGAAPKHLHCRPPAVQKPRMSCDCAQRPSVTQTTRHVGVGQSPKKAVTQSRKTRKRSPLRGYPSSTSPPWPTNGPSPRRGLR